MCAPYTQQLFFMASHCRASTFARHCRALTWKNFMDSDKKITGILSGSSPRKCLTFFPSTPMASCRLKCSECCSNDFRGCMYTEIAQYRLHFLFLLPPCISLVSLLSFFYFLALHLHACTEIMYCEDLKLTENKSKAVFFRRFIGVLLVSSRCMV